MKNQIRRLSATEAARDFKKLLDAVEAGGEAIIMRHSRPAAVIGPPNSAPRRISECLAVPFSRPSTVPDPEFGADLREVIRGHVVSEPPGWD